MKPPEICVQATWCLIARPSGYRRRTDSFVHFSRSHLHCSDCDTTRNRTFNGFPPTARQSPCGDVRILDLYLRSFEGRRCKACGGPDPWLQQSADDGESRREKVKALERKCEAIRKAFHVAGRRSDLRRAAVRRESADCGPQAQRSFRRHRQQQRLCLRC